MLLQAYRRMSYVEAILNVSRADHTMRGTEDTSATLDNRPFLTVKGMVDEIVTVSVVSQGASSAAMKFALRLRCGCDGYKTQHGQIGVPKHHFDSSPIWFGLLERSQSPPQCPFPIQSVRQSSVHCMEQDAGSQATTTSASGPTRIADRPHPMSNVTPLDHTGSDGLRMKTEQSAAISKMQNYGPIHRSLSYGIT
jgi:hypothetical protein